jgi:bleomycin hydrolase
MKYPFTFRCAALIAAVAFVGFAAFSNGALAGDRTVLTETVIEELKASFELDESNRALVNAMTNNDIRDLAYNRELYIRHDDLFSNKIETKGITNQESSGRCWLFAGFNIMRPTVMEKFDVEQFEFSENHLFFWDKLEKANMFLEAIIETKDADIDDRELQTLLKDPIPDGGWWSYVVGLIEKYGAVPKGVMPETKNSSNTRYMNATLNSMARSFAAELRGMAAKGAGVDALRDRKMEMLKDVYRVLALHLGVPPDAFTWRYEDKDKKIREARYTPQSFYREAVGVDLADYVTLFDHAAHAYDKYFQIKYCRNMPDRPDMTFINIEAGRLREFTLASVLAGDPVWFAADVGKENDYKNGIMAVGTYDYDALMGVGADLSKADRISYGESTPNHAMAFIGVDMKDGEPAKWLVENSWGTDRGNKGLWSMYNCWFDEYVYTVIIHKKHLPKEVLALLGTEPEVLPAWDPMRSAFDR